MQSGTGEVSQRNLELIPLNVIRVETALSRYPVHRLAKQGIIAIEIREENSAGEVVIRWEVSHNSKFGQPGPLAYKLDTLIVNRRIEEAARPVPRMIHLGTLTGIAEQLGLGGDTNKVKNALRQNAFAGIVAKLRYKGGDGSEQTIEADFTRYHVVFTGEKLPDGRKADAVYLILSDIFMQVINGAQTRPLDYDYLKDLPPASQRLYELLSFQMYATLKNSRKEARLSYAEFCTYAPLTRFAKWDQVRPQMARIHRPHRESGYIDRVEFEQTADREGKPDWLMVYVPGFKAKAEFRAFNRRGGPRILEVEQNPTASNKVEPTSIEQELIGLGVTASIAAELVSSFPAERISAQIEHFDWLKVKHPKKISDNPGGFLASAIRDNYNPPKGFESKTDRENRLACEEAKRQTQLNDARQKRASQHREAELEKQITKRWDAMTPDERASTEAKALAATDEDIRRQYDDAKPPFRRLLMTSIRRGFLRKLVEEEANSH